MTGLMYCSLAGQSCFRGYVALSLIDFFPGKKPVSLIVKVLAGTLVHHVQLLFIDEHGLMVLPFRPGLRGYARIDFLAPWPREGRGLKAWQFLLQALAKNFV